MSKNRPAISEEIKRLVRQKCFFGCIICGKPIFEYDHLVEYSIVEEHTVENIILLCPEHHSGKTTGKISFDRVNEAAKMPFNSLKTHSSPLYLENDVKLDVQLGSIFIYGGDFSRAATETFILINGIPYLQVHKESKWFSLSFIITDNVGKPLVKVDKGELVISTEIFDYTYIGNRLTIRQKMGKIIFDLNLSSNLFKLNKGMFYYRWESGFSIENDRMFVSKNGKISMTLKEISILIGGGSVGFMFTDKNYFEKMFMTAFGVVVEKGE